MSPETADELGTGLADPVLPLADAIEHGSSRSLRPAGPELGLFEVRPSAWFVAIESAGTVFTAVVVAALATAAAILSDWLPASTATTVVHGAGAIVAMRVLLETVRWANTAHFLTSRRALSHRGITTIETEQIALEELADVVVRRPMWTRLTGTASLEIYLDGARQPVMTWEHLTSAEEVREALLAAAARWQRRYPKRQRWAA